MHIPDWTFGEWVLAVSIGILTSILVGQLVVFSADLLA
jgi:hypothetical protein